MTSKVKKGKSNSFLSVTRGTLNKITNVDIINARIDE